MYRQIHFLLTLLLLTASCNGQYSAQSPKDTETQNHLDFEGLPQNTIIQSNDGGITWQKTANDLPDGVQLTNFFVQGNDLFIGSKNGSVYQTENTKSAKWEQKVLGDTLKKEQYLTVFEGKLSVFAYIYQVGLFKKSFKSNTWEVVKGLEGGIVHDVAEDKTGKIWVASKTGLFLSEDDGTTWQQVFAESWVGSITEKDGILIGSYRDGLIRSTDGGKTWEKVLNDSASNYQVKSIGEHFAAVRWNGFQNPTAAISLDAGKTWKVIEENNAFGLNAKEYFQENWKVYPTNWQPQSPKEDNFWQNFHIFDLEQVGNYLFCSHKVGISRSADGGKTWEHIFVLPRQQANVRIILKSFGKTLYASAVPNGC